jgi:hypothetical protein
MDAVDPAAWTQEVAEAAAAAYASAHVDLVEMTRRSEVLKGALRRYMETHGLDELIDPEVGEGVVLGPPPRAVQWDTRSMQLRHILELRDLGALEVVTAVADAAIKRSPSMILDEIKRYRFEGLGTRPLRVAAK